MRRRSGAGRLNQLGFLSVVALALALPFNLAKHPLFATAVQPVTNLALLIILVCGLAALSLLAAGIQAGWGRSGAVPVSAAAWRRLAWAAFFLLALVAVSAISSIAAHRLVGGLPWILDLLAGGLICMALPLWLAEAAEYRITVIVGAFVAGAMIAAIAGFAEFWLGADFEHWLVWFRPGPTTMGPYLRLTGTFHYANEAAGYFTLALPFALVGLSRSFTRARPAISAAAWAIATGVLLVALLLTFSRGGLVGLAASLVVMAIATRGTQRRRWSWRYAGTLIVVAVVPIAAFLAWTLPIDVVRLSTQNDTSWYRVGYTSSVPATLSVGERRVLPVAVENLSLLTWTSSARHDYGLSYHWLYPSWRVAQFNAPITWIQGRVDPGRSRTVRAAIQPPSRPGRYLLVWDVLWHGTTWFGLKTGDFRPYRVRVLSDPVRGESRALQHSSQPETRPVTTLPLSQTAGRTQIWSRAARLIAQHPLLGLGPRGFRRYYATTTSTSPHRRVPPPPNAHNLMLELAADWGIPAGIVFLLLVGTLWQPLCAVAYRGTMVNRWDVAILGAGTAFAAYSAVEFSLGAPAILFAGWVLCGLAVTVAGSSGPGARPV